MSWTYRNAPEMLRLYPELANMGVLVSSWPSLRQTVQRQQTSGQSDKSELRPKDSGPNKKP